MPAVVVPVPQFATVPNLPGVPPLKRAPGDPTLAAIFAIEDAIIGAVLFGQTQWGIFTTSGEPALTADSVFAMEYARDYKIPDYPQEQGAFQSYNKVRVPYQAKITYTLNQDRVEFLNSAEAVTASLDLYTVVTPEVTYPTANPTHYSLRREARDGGVSLVKVDVWVEEVRPTGTAFLTQSAQQASAGGGSGGGGGGSTGGPGGGAPLAPSPTTTGTLSNTQSVSGAATQQNGTEQPQPAPPNAPWIVNIQ